MRALPAPSAAWDPARPSAVERLAADRARFSRRPAGAGDPASRGRGAGDDGDRAPEPRGPGPAAVPRRAVSRRPPRPDSLVIYRQRCDFARGAGAQGPRGGPGRELLAGPGRGRTQPAQATPEPAASPRGPAAPAPAPAPAPAQPAPPGSPGPCAPRTSPPRVARRAGLQRSHSDLSRRSRDPGAELDAFFRFCGLDTEVVEALGRDNFSAGSDSAARRVRSTSVATSEGGFSRPSDGGDAGLQEEALPERAPSSTSVVERNARIIKWLYTCRKAAGTPGQGLQGPA